MIKRIDEVHYINPITGAIVNVPYICKQWRISNNYKLSDVARDTGYGLSSIAGFERGYNNNLVIFLWYYEHGLDLKKFVKVGE